MNMDSLLGWVAGYLLYHYPPGRITVRTRAVEVELDNSKMVAS